MLVLVPVNSEDSVPHGQGHWILIQLGTHSLRSVALLKQNEKRGAWWCHCACYQKRKQSHQRRTFVFFPQKEDAERRTFVFWSDKREVPEMLQVRLGATTMVRSYKRIKYSAVWRFSAPARVEQPIAQDCNLLSDTHTHWVIKSSVFLWRKGATTFF